MASLATYIPAATHQRTVIIFVHFVMPRHFAAIIHFAMYVSDPQWMEDLIICNASDATVTIT